MLKVLLIAIAVAAAISGTALADAFTPALIANIQAEGKSQFMTGVRGSCGAKSHIAIGPVGSDLTKHQTPFACDAAVMVFFDKQNRHIMIVFAEKAKTKQVIAFSGIMDPKSNTMPVQKIYFDVGKPTYIDDGGCKLFFSNKHMTGIFCGGKIDADGQRTVASIVFNADPGQ